MNNSVKSFSYIIPDTCCATLEENNYNEVSALYVRAYQLSINFPQYLVMAPLLRSSCKHSWQQHSSSQDNIYSRERRSGKTNSIEELSHGIALRQLFYF